MIKVVIVDDHKLFLEGVEGLLLSSNQFEVVGKFSEGKSFLSNASSFDYDLLIIDLDMPEINGLDVIRRIRLSNTLLKIVVVSMHGETAFFNEAKKLGANGYLTKAIDGAELVESLLQVCRGVNIFPVFKTIESKYDTLLSEREIEILRLLIRGNTSEEVSESLKISPLTVKVHRRNMMRKLKAKNSMALFTRALELGLL